MSVIRKGSQINNVQKKDTEQKESRRIMMLRILNSVLSNNMICMYALYHLDLKNRWRLLETTP